METTPVTRRNRRRRRRLLAALTAVMAVGSSATVALSLALFTSQAAVAAPFSAGTVTIQANGTSSPAVGAVTFASPSGIMPGWASTGKVLIHNAGADARYSMVSVSSGSATNLADALRVSIEVQAGDVACGGGTEIVADATLNGVGFGTRNLTAGQDETLCFNVSLPLATGNAYQGTNATTTFTFNAEQVAYNP